MKMRLTTIALASATAGSMAGCGRTATTSAVKTDLGSVGNERVFDNFYLYQQKSEHCAAGGPGKRVIVSGFGLFTGVPYNISGVVVSSFADAAFTPAAVTLTRGLQAAAPPQSQTPASGTVAADAQGGVAVNRSMSIDGSAYEVCFLTLDVIWDQAASIILYEADQFKPQMVYMTGRNSENVAVFEGGAANSADSLAGYNADGSQASDNAPVDTYVLNPNVEGTLVPAPREPMTWSNVTLAAATKSRIAALGYPVQAPAQWRDGNDYLCNNVSYVLLSAARGVPVSLAGDWLSVESTLAPTTKIGFMHFPASADNAPAHVRAWVGVMAKAIRLTLP